MNSVSLKAKIKKIAKAKGVGHQRLLYNFFFDELLRKIFSSKYTNMFVLHGGFLLEILAGVDVRTTTDIDLSIIQDNLKLKDIFENICSVQKDDKVIFQITKVGPVTAHISGSIRIHITGKFEKIINPFYIDLVKESFNKKQFRKIKYTSIFDEQTFQILIPGFANLIANKLDAILKRGTKTTRGKDFYDLYIYKKLISKNFSFTDLRKYLTNMLPNITKDKANKIVSELSTNSQIKHFVTNFLTINGYQEKVKFEDTIESLLWFINKIL